MLIELLQIVERGGIQSPQQLADELGVSPSLVVAMLDDLVRIGYLEPLAGGCSSDACGNCSAPCLGQASGNAAAWVLTVRGSKALSSRLHINSTPSS